LPLPEARGELPVTRYKVKVEHDGARPAADGDPGQVVPAAPEIDTTEGAPTNSTSTSTKKNNTANTSITATAAGKQDEGGEEAAGVSAAAAATAAATSTVVEVGDSSGFANPTLAQLVLVPAREAPIQRATSAAGEGDSLEQQGRRRRTLVTVRGLKPRTRYRILVRSVFGRDLQQQERRPGVCSHDTSSRGLLLWRAVTTCL